MTVTVREFTSVAEMRAHYAALQNRFMPRARPIAQYTRPAPIAKPEDNREGVPPPEKSDLSVAELVAKYLELDTPQTPEEEEAGRVFRRSKLNRRILRAVAARHGVYISDIIGQGRSKKFVEARHEAIEEIHKQNPDWSLGQIGQLFRRDHTSIGHALCKRGAISWASKRNRK